LFQGIVEESEISFEIDLIVTVFDIFDDGAVFFFTFLTTGLKGISYSVEYPVLKTAR
jgi:hypothetical protein